MNDSFKPYIPADKIVREMTPTSIVLGVILAIVFGASNAYLGLVAGTTVSASIPAAVISMGIIRVILKKDSVLENNIVQTTASAGESVAAGVIFTVPALFLWAKEGVTKAPNLVMISLMALCGGIIGILFMVPLRNALIVKEHGVLPYPEGTACAEVLLATEEGGNKAKFAFIGIGISMAIKFITDGLKIAASKISLPIKALKAELDIGTSPALIGVGYICGPQISGKMFAGGILSWFVLIPIIVVFGGKSILFPGTEKISQIYASGGAGAIWSNYIRYIGAGAVAAAGIISLIKTMPVIVKTFIGAVKSIKSSENQSFSRTEQDLKITTVGAGILACLLLIVFALPGVKISFVPALLIIIFSFFFAAVSSRMVGLVGSTNNPISGMTIATLLMTSGIFRLMGNTGGDGMTTALVIGGIICIVAAIAGDTSQDLKTGYILGSTPKKQQIGEIIGVAASALVIGGILVLLNNAWGFGSPQIPAPQATLMKMIVEGVMKGNLPWNLVFIGAFISIVIEVLGMASLPVAIGLYLPIETSSTIMIGGLIRLVVDKAKSRKANKENEEVSSGTLLCSGLIAGEGLVGILIAIFTVTGFDKVIDLSKMLNGGSILGAVILICLIAVITRIAIKGNKKDKNEK